MFSRRNRRPASPDLSEAWECLDTDDVPGALRRLRQADTALLDQVALVGRAARAAGFDGPRQSGCVPGPSPSSA